MSLMHQLVQVEPQFDVNIKTIKDSDSEQTKDLSLPDPPSINGHNTWSLVWNAFLFQMQFFNHKILSEILSCSTLWMVYKKNP